MTKVVTWEVGDKVRMCGDFLRNTGQHTGYIGTRFGTVVSIGITIQSGNHLVSVRWNDYEVGKVLSCNLERCPF